MVVEDARWELTDEIFVSHAWQMHANAGDERCREDAQTEDIGKACPLSSAIELESVARVLTMDVVERVVGVLLALKGPDAGALESHAEAQPPLERGLDVSRKRTG